VFLPCIKHVELSAKKERSAKAEAPRSMLQGTLAKADEFENHIEKGYGCQEKD